MPPGKMAAQAGHAFLQAYLASESTDAQAYNGDGIGTKITLEASLEDILETQHKLVQAGVPCVLIEDSGHVLPPHFDGSPIVTALGVGLNPNAPNLLRKFKLLGVTS